MGVITNSVIIQAGISPGPKLQKSPNTQTGISLGPKIEQSLSIQTGISLKPKIEQSLETVGAKHSQPTAGHPPPHDPRPTRHPINNKSTLSPKP